MCHALSGSPSLCLCTLAASQRGSVCFSVIGSNNASHAWLPNKPGSEKWGGVSSPLLQIVQGHTLLALSAAKINCALQSVVVFFFLIRLRALFYILSETQVKAMDYERLIFLSWSSWLLMLKILYLTGASFRHFQHTQSCIQLSFHRWHFPRFP